jgi:hypothetical protein
MAALGPDLISKGVLVSVVDLLGLLMERAEEFGQGCSAALNGKPIDIGMLGKSTVLAEKDRVFLTVKIGPVYA